MVDQKNIVRIRGSIQQYEWGKPGSSSLAAKFAAESVGSDQYIDENQTYAELWMGTHTNGPAVLFDSPDQTLHSLVSSDPKHCLGADLIAKWPETNDIPFLFKILSIHKALPLQAHPDKSLGAQLNKADPSQFVDANHKPEIAVSLGGKVDSFGRGDDVAFTGFCGFRPIQEIAKTWKAIPELAMLVGDASIAMEWEQKPSQETLKRVFAALLLNGQQNYADVARHVQTLAGRIESGELTFGSGAAADTQAKLFIKLNTQYPGDIGVVVATLFMNLVTLKKGEAIYIGADEVHAYLEGDIIECMAISDNVVNAAFCPPEGRDVSTFQSMLTYTSRPASHWALPRKPSQLSGKGRTSAFCPPLEEFDVLWTELSGGVKDEFLKPSKGPTIGIVLKGTVKFTTKGESLTLPEGGIAFIAANSEVHVELLKGEQADVWWSTYSG
ncbi:mannose-6-phosphate isomerase [Punctularia strigosozonata HHB-11173 SS5]|uniref:mannose-6-phosphate isomerase n=1 Tax=Punctularia strigosozonata (strain HHB-11173) TaxID=741275 RepID=UPI0004416328|nr:mannose-6-phosphate isomerase [Punctularia strigosozonata HHB-11173 SS5]EIN12725.1 mannose-6-phosphate isomerase [Punctularia strigosozonata HHB-11173 SS5]